jgi:N-acetylneuraminic acid mutarotase
VYIIKYWSGNTPDLRFHLEICIKNKMKNMLKFLTLIFVLPIATFAQWTSISSLPGAGTDGCFSATVDGKAYVGGGLGRNALYEYNPSTNTWTKKANIPGPAQRAWSGSFTVDNKIYIIGGDSTFGGLLKDVWMYDPSTDQWTKKTDYPGGRRDGMFTWVLTVDGKTKVYVGGGFDGSVILNDFYVYDPEADSWKTLVDNIPAPMLFASTFVLNNKGYVTLWEGGGFFNNLWEFDPASSSWTEKATCPAIPRGEGIGVAINGKGYAGLGQTDFKKGYTDLYVYNPNNNTWAKVKDTFPDLHTGWSTAFVIGSTLYAGTGATLPGFNFGNSFYKYAPNPTDLADVEFTQSDLWPNPVKDMLTVNIPEVQQVKFLDMQGKCVRDLVLDESLQLSVQGLPAGLYTVCLYSPAGVLTRKLVIQD